VRESVTVLAPIFGLFLLTHAILIVAGIGAHAGDVPRVACGGDRRVPPGTRHPRRGRPVRGFRPRVCNGRGYLHRHRGRVERSSDHARAQGRDGAEDDGAHGCVSGHHGGRDRRSLPAVRRATRRRQDDERRCCSTPSPVTGGSAE
jgi:hypothetical protein